MGARILIIEDNSITLEFMSYLLESYGYSAIAARNGKVGIEAAGRERPDLVLCDLNMPAIDGYEVVKLLRADKSHNETPHAAVTASSMPGDREQVLDSGCNGYIPKPIVSEASVQKLEAFLASTSDVGVKLKPAF